MDEIVKVGLYFAAAIIVTALLLYLDHYVKEKEEQRSRQAVKDEVRGKP